MLGDKERHRRRPRNIVGGLILAFIVIGIVGALAHPLPAGAAVNTAPPATPVKLVFIHHSTGQAWLEDGHGGLGIALRNNNYFVSDTNYGWGPDAIGDTTDIGHWWTWFRGPSSPTFLTDLYAESATHSSYSRLATDPGGPNQIVMFKSCFPNSQLSGPDSPVPAISDNPMKGQPAGVAFTVANAKGIYLDLLPYFGAHPEKLFVAVVAPPVTSPDTPGGRALANWLVDHWLQDAGYTAGNVLVFDFYNVLTSKTGGGANDLGLATGNHHRVWNGAVQHKTDGGADRLAYPSAGGDSHPNAAGDQKATAEFVPLLNAAYNAWVGNGGSDATPPTTTATGAANGTWYKSAVTVTLSAEDNPGGSGVAKTEYRLDAGSWMTGTSVTVTAPTGGANDGTHTVAYRSTDLAGNVEVGKTCTVNIDTPRPTTKAPSSATARRGRTAALKYQVLDTVPNGGTATVTIKVKNRAGKVVKTLKPVVKPVNTSLTWKFTVPRTWRTGTYRFYVSAHRDTAGNVGANVASNKLIVR